MEPEEVVGMVVEQAVVMAIGQKNTVVVEEAIMVVAEAIMAVVVVL